MITLDLNLPQMRATVVAAAIETVFAGAASKPDVRPPTKGVASDPFNVWLAVGPKAQVTDSELKIRLPELEWTTDHEERFALLAGREATGELTGEQSRELEHLSALRRGMKNSRLGEELVWEYQQRELTRELIKALDRYVSFHKSSNRP